MPPPEPAHEPPAAWLRFEVTPKGGGAPLILKPGAPSAELDELLAAEGAETLVFMPLYEPEKAWKKPREMRYGRRLEKRRRKLGKDEAERWGSGSVSRSDGTLDPLPAAWSTDVRRFRARLIADDLGVQRFYWARRGGPLEQHSVEPFTDDAFELEAVRVLSRRGLQNMAQTAASLDQIEEASASVGSDLRQLMRTSWLLGGASALVCGVMLLALLFPDSPSTGGLRSALETLGVFAHPILLPALVLGAYMRRHLGLAATERAAESRRELSEDEVSRAWQQSAPHLLVVWLLAAFSVLMLTVGRQAVGGTLHPAMIVDSFSSYCLTVLWILTPLTYSRDTASAIGASLEAGITVLVALFVLKLTMFIANAATHFMWLGVGWVLPFVVPDWIREPFDALTSIAAELFFFVLILGYTWTKAREHFGRWATVAVPPSPEAPEAPADAP